MTSDTRTALLDVAEHAARARGLDGFSYADLASAVGIRKASIHYHFPTKADLTAQLIARYHEAMEQTCTDIVTRYETASDRLQALILHYRSALNGGKTLCLCVSLTGSRESLSREVIERIGQFRAMMLDWIETVFELGIGDGTISNMATPRQEARAALALMEGAHLAARAEEDAHVFDQAVELMKARCR